MAAGGYEMEEEGAAGSGCSGSDHLGAASEGPGLYFPDPGTQMLTDGGSDDRHAAWEGEEEERSEANPLPMLMRPEELLSYPVQLFKLAEATYKHYVPDGARVDEEKLVDAVYNRVEPFVVRSSCMRQEEGRGPP